MNEISRKKSLGILARSLVVTYLLTALVKWNINAADWGAGARLTWIVLAIGLATMATSVARKKAQE